MKSIVASLSFLALLGLALGAPISVQATGVMEDKINIEKRGPGNLDVPTEKAKEKTEEVGKGITQEQPIKEKVPQKTDIPKKEIKPSLY